MKNLIFLLLLFINLSQGFGQKQRNISCNIDLHVNNTLYDRTLSNNATGFGFGLQTLVKIKPRFKALLDVAADAYGGTKDFFLALDGKPIYAKDQVVTAFAGVVFQPQSTFFAGITAGAGFFNSKAYFGIKPVIGISFLHQHLVFKMGMVNIFQRDEISNKSFGYLTFGMGVRLF